MTERITARDFHEADDVDDWRALAHGACARFRTGSFAAGVELVEAIGELADAANHHPDVDLRYGSVTVRLVTHEVGGLSHRDVDLARQISVAARRLDVDADPSAVQDIDLTIDALSLPDVMPFWAAVLGFDQKGDEDLIDPYWRWPSIWFQETDEPREQRNRIHVDVWVPPDQAETRVRAAIAAGGRLVRDESPTWWTLADPEGNEVDIATVSGRD